MAYSREPQFPLVEIDEKLRQYIDRVDRYTGDFTRTFPALCHPQRLKVARTHLTLAHKSLIRAYLKAFHKNYPYRNTYGVTHRLQEGVGGFTDWLSHHIREYSVFIHKIETLHLQMGEQGCNFWSFIALEKAVMEVQFAQYELKRISNIVFEREVKNHVHPSNKSSTDQVGIPSSG